MRKWKNIFIFIIALSISLCAMSYAYAQDMDEDLFVLIEPVVDSEKTEQYTEEKQPYEEDKTTTIEESEDTPLQSDDAQQDDYPNPLSDLFEEDEEQEIIETIEEEIKIDITEIVEPEEAEGEEEIPVKKITMDINEVQDIDLQKDIQNILEINASPDDAEFIYLVCYGTEATITMGEYGTVQKETYETDKTYIKLNKANDKYILTISPKETGKLRLCTMTDKMYDFYVGVQETEEILQDETNNSETKKEETALYEESEIEETIDQIDVNEEVQTPDMEKEDITEGKDNSDENGTDQENNDTEQLTPDLSLDEDIYIDQDITEEELITDDTDDNKTENPDTLIEFVSEEAEEQPPVITGPETELEPVEVAEETDTTDTNETAICDEEILPDITDQTENNEQPLNVVIEPEEELYIDYMKVNSKAVTVYAEVGTVPDNTVVVSQQLSPEKTQTLINKFAIDNKEEINTTKDIKDAVQKDEPESKETNIQKTKAYNGYAAFDISLSAEGTKFSSNGNFKVIIQPENINIFSQLPEDATVNSVTYDLYHIHNGIHCEKLSSCKVMTNETGDIDNITLETHDFSEFVLRYTVEFTYTNPVTSVKKIYSINGGQAVNLSAVLKSLNIWDVDLKNSKVYFTNPELLEISKKTDAENNVCDWSIKNLKPFDTEEMLTVILSDRTMLLIKVTDSMDIMPEKENSNQTADKENIKSEPISNNTLVLISIIAIAMVMFSVYVINEINNKKEEMKKH